MKPLDPLADLMRDFVARGALYACTPCVKAILAFGLVKGVLNFVAGRLSESIGRKKVLVLGWLVALPVPVIVWLAPSWNWIVFATVLLGFNQGLCWSMTQTAKLDITRAEERGLTLGLNEFAGYVGVAAAGIITAYLAAAFGARVGLLVFGLPVVGIALVLSMLALRETLPWAHAEIASHEMPDTNRPRPRYPAGVTARPAIASGATWAMVSAPSAWDWQGTSPAESRRPLLSSRSPWPCQAPCSSCWGKRHTRGSIPLPRFPPEGHDDPPDVPRPQRHDAGGAGARALGDAWRQLAGK